jgi:hypothetical protein
MTQYRHRRSSIPATPFPTPIEPGEIAVNTSDRQIVVGDAAPGSSGAPLPLLAVRFFDARAIYNIDDLVAHGGIIYRASRSNGPGPFTATDWIAGGTQLVVSDTAPTGLLPGSLWWESDSGILYVLYADINSTAWIIAAPQPDISLFVQRAGDSMGGPLILVGNPTSALEAAPKQYVDAGDAAKVAKAGDTMSGPLVLPAAAPTLGTHATNKTYVDAGDATAVRYSAQTPTAAEQAQARANIGVARKNYIINGAMMISQENGATAGTTNGYIPADQFTAFSGNAGTFSAAQVQSATPGGSPNRLRFTVTAADASVAAGDIAGMGQSFEGLRIADLAFGASLAKTITLRFGVRAPAGIYCVGFRNGAYTRSYVAEYTIAAGEANTDVVRTITIPGDVAGAWQKDNTRALDINWMVMCGANFVAPANAWTAGHFLATANQFNLFGSNGNVFELFDVSLTEGTVAPPFQVPDYASELALCQRYYGKFPLMWRGYVSAGSLWGVSFPLPVAMRTTPTCSLDGISRSNVAGAIFSTTDPSTVNVLITAGAATGDSYIFGEKLTANARL